MWPEGVCGGRGTRGEVGKMLWFSAISEGAVFPSLEVGQEGV